MWMERLRGGGSEPMGGVWPRQRLPIGVRLETIAESRRLLWATVVLCASIMWLTPRLPMVDLPQHAAQIALWRDLISANSPWDGFVQTNLKTPYLVGYMLALPFAAVLPIESAIRIVLSVACLSFIAASIALRREYGADQRLDWLIVPSFYGLAWKWGYYPFLVAAPFMVLLIHLALKHVRNVQAKTGCAIFAIGTILLFAHGMAFLFGCALAVLIVLQHSITIRKLAVAMVPFVLLGIVMSAFVLFTSGFDTPFESVRFIWGFDPVVRMLSLIALCHDFTAGLALLSMGLLLVPLVLGLELNRAALLPAGFLAAWVLVMPKDMLGAVHWAERFGMLTMLFFALAWRRPTREEATSAAPGASLLLVLACWASLASTGWRIHQFGYEAADFEVVLGAAQSGKRALNVTVDPSSTVVDHPFQYIQHAAWYQADKQGLVDYNFASLHNLVVRYRQGQRPPLDVDFAWRSHNVDWHKHRARAYDYYFVRHGEKQIPPQLIHNGECRIETVATSGAWTLLKRGECKP